MRIIAEGTVRQCAREHARAGASLRQWVKVVKAARQAIEPLAGFEERLTTDQADYLEAVSSFLETFDRGTMKWHPGKPVDTLRFLIEQRGMTAADLSRLLGTDRSLGSKILRGERRLTLDHVRILARHFQVEPGLFL